MTVHRLRVEDRPPKAEATRTPPAGPAGITAQDVDHWRKLAVQNGERLRVAEIQLKDLRREADEARARFSKYKQRLDAANERVNDLQVALTTASAERDVLRARLPRLDVLKRKVYDYRQSLQDGPIWDVFAELCNDVSAAEAGEERKQP